MKKTMRIAQILILLLFVVNLSACGRNSGSESQGTDTQTVLLPVKEDPTIAYRIWFKVGSQNDPKGKEGLAQITALMLTQGSTKNNSFEQILQKLYPMAASYSSKVDKEMTIIYGRTHKDNLEGYYALLKDAIMQPAFKQEDFDRIKSLLLNAIEKELRYSSDEELGKAALYDYVFEGTPYGHLTMGTVEGLNSITLDDVKNFYKQYYTKDNFVIGMGGSYKDSDVRAAEHDLDILPAGTPPQPTRPSPERLNGRTVLLVDKDASATAISFGFPIDVVRGQDDFFALALFNSWFGEHRNSSSHLYQVLRELRGLNYGDYSYIEPFLHGGELQMPEPNNPRRQQIFEVWIRPVQNQNRVFALRAALRELKNVVDNGLTKDQFDLTKKFLYKYALHYAPTTMERLGYEIDSRYYGIDDNGNYIEYFRKRINDLTLEQVNAAIRRNIQYNNIKIAMVTSGAEKLKQELASDKPSPIKYTVPVSEQVLAEDKNIENFPLGIKAEDIKIIKVDDIFQK